MKIILKIFASLLIVCASIVNAQDLSKYYGTYSGKQKFDKTADISSKVNYEVNEVSLKVSPPNKSF